VVACVVVAWVNVVFRNNAVVEAVDAVVEAVDAVVVAVVDETVLTELVDVAVVPPGNRTPLMIS